MRIALVAATDWQPAPWQARIIDRIARDPLLQLVALIPGVPRGLSTPALALRGLNRVEGALLHRRLPLPDPSAARARLRDLPRETAKAAKADLALALDLCALTPADLAACPMGEWSLSFAGLPPGALPERLLPRPRDPDGLWPISVTARTMDGAHDILRRGYNPKALTSLNACFLTEKAGILLIKALRLATLGQLPPPIARMQPPALPGLTEVLGYGAATMGQITARALTRLRESRSRGRDFWALAAGTGGIDGLAPGAAEPLPRLRHTMADPFLFDHEGRLYLFYEAQNADNRPAWIEVAELRGNDLIAMGTALRLPYHLSFPFVFRHGDQILMMPETQQNKRLEIWRATRFPLEWELMSTAFTGQHLAESSLLNHQGQWWLFTNLSNEDGFQEHSSEMQLFAVDGPDLREIRPHPLNPVVIGSGSARNGGAVLSIGGRLFRPAQINAHGQYGWGLSVMEITRLDSSHYEERPLHRFTPADRPGWQGMHHLTMAGGHWVIDWRGGQGRGLSLAPGTIAIGGQ